MRLEPEPQFGPSSFEFPVLTLQAGSYHPHQLLKTAASSSSTLLKERALVNCNLPGCRASLTITGKIDPDPDLKRGSLPFQFFSRLYIVKMYALWEENI